MNPKRNKRLENDPTVGSLVYELNLHKENLVKAKEDIVTEAKDTLSEVKNTLTDKIKEANDTLSQVAESVEEMVEHLKTITKGEPGDSPDEEAIEERLLAKIPKLEEIVNNINVEEIAEKASSMIKPTPASLKIIKESVQLDKEELVPMLNEATNLKDLKLSLDNISDISTLRKDLNAEISRNKAYKQVSGGGFNNIAQNGTIKSTGLTTLNFTGATVSQSGSTVTVAISGSGLTLETDGTPNGDQTLLNLVAGTNMTLTDDGNGNITFDATGGSGSPGGSTTQLQYNNAGAFGGITGATTDGTSVTYTTGNLKAADVKASGSGGLSVLSNAGTQTALFGAGGGANNTFYGDIKGDYLTASEMLITDASKNIISAPVATYPSLTELSYVKGVTSAIQTQLNAKGSGTVTSVTSANGDATVATTTTTPVITIVSAPKLTTARTIGTITGDATSAGSTFDGTANNTNALTLATVNSNVGSFGSATASPVFTVNAKGLITAASSTTITPAVGSITGLGTGVATALAVNVGSAGAFVTFNGALGTPSSGTVTNLTGTASININGTVGATTPTTGSFTTVTTSGNIELGNASDTTLSRVSAGVIAIEGVTVDTISAANTLTNKTLTTPVINGATLNGDLQIDATPNTDDTWNGKSTNTFNAGATVAQFDCVYLSSSSTWLLTDADAIGTAGNVLVMMAGASGTNGNALRVIEPGSWVRNDAWNWTVGGVLYLDTATPGGMTQTVPSGTDDAVKIVGHAVTADVIYFNPSVNWIIHT